MSSTLLFNVLFPFSSQAVLNATSTNTIQGSAPYLTFDNGATKETDMSALLGITLSNGVSYNPANNPSSASTPIELPVVGQTIADVQMYVPTTTNSIGLDSLIGAPYHYWHDDNGDGEGANGIDISGTLTLHVQDANDNTLNRDDTINVCLSPYYKVTLSSTAGSLITQYGVPNKTTYDAASETYYIKPHLDTPYACYAQSNMSYKGNEYNGPAIQWNSKKGFIIQDINTPSSNFPTMGAHGLFFKLSVVGATWDTVTYSKSPDTSGLSLRISDGGSSDLVKIMLVGPKDGDNAAIANSAVPTTFSIYSDVAKTNKIYSFTISKWFIARRGITPNGYDADYCHNTYGNDYRIPSVLEYTNANGDGWTNGLAGQPNHYQYRIGGGLFAEWGETVNYANSYTESDFDYYEFWAIESYGTLQRVVKARNGYVASNIPNRTATRLACVKP